MDELEKAFFKAITGYDYDESFRIDFSYDQALGEIQAKAAASLCREKCKEAIKLARGLIVPTDDGGFRINQRSEREILDTLNKKV